MQKVQRNPWDEQGPTQPQGNKPDGTPKPMTINDLIQKAKQEISKTSNSQGGDKTPIPAFKVGPKTVIGALVGLSLLWGVTGFYKVNEGEVGVVSTFGKVTSQTGVGLKWHIPAPIQSVAKVALEERRRLSISSLRRSASMPASSGAFRRKAPVRTNSEQYFLTGDISLIEVDMVVTWRVADPVKYLYSVANLPDVLTEVASATAREVTARTGVDDVLTTGREQFQTDAAIRLNQVMEQYDAGIVIERVELQEVNAPEAVREAFAEVQRAQQYSLRVVTEANAERNRFIPQARAEAAKILADASAYNTEVRELAQAEAFRFNSLLKEHQQQPDIVTSRLYFDTARNALTETSIIFSEESPTEGADSSKTHSLQPLLPLYMTPSTSPLKNTTQSLQLNNR